MVFRSDILFPSVRPNATHEGHCEIVTQPVGGHDKNNSPSFMSEFRRATHVQLRASLVSGLGLGLNSAIAFASNQLNFLSLYEGRDRKSVSCQETKHTKSFETINKTIFNR